MKKSRRKLSGSTSRRAKGKSYGHRSGRSLSPSDDGAGNSRSDGDEQESVNRFAEDCSSDYKLGKPMKDRHFPASFWLQPNRPSANVRQPLAPGARRGELLETRTHAIRIPTPPDTNLLFSLFKILEHQHHTSSAGSRTVDELQQRVALRSLHNRKSSRSTLRRERSRNEPNAMQPESARLADAGGLVSSTSTAIERLPDVVTHTMLLTTVDIGHVQSGVDVAHGVDELVDDDNDTISSSEDPYLTLAGAMQAAEQRRRSMLSTMLSANGSGASGTGVNGCGAGGGGRGSDDGQVGSSSSCYSDLLSDLVVNL